MSADLEFHPLAEIFPTIYGAEFDALASDIAAHGLREPIVLFEGAILDGRNRYRACAEAGVPARFETYTGSDPVSYVVSLNLRRRHLDESQRAMVAARLANLRDGQRKTASPIGERAVSQADAAKMLNVGKRSVERAVEVRDQGAPDLIAAVDRGKVSVSAAADVATLPKARQAEVVKWSPDDIVKEANRIKRHRKETKREERKAEIADLAAVAAPAGARHDLRRAPCSSILALAPNSAEWFITDPPYPKEFLPVYDELGAAAAHALRPGGSLLCMVGQSYLPDVIAMLGKHLTYHWTLAYLTPGGQAVQVFPRRVNTFWKPVLWFVKAEFDGSWIGDSVASKTNDNDKRFHEWGQSESGMLDLMARFVRPGETVVDPFMGAGTTGVVALALGAKFIGLDINEDAFNEATVRMDRAAKLVA